VRVRPKCLLVDDREENLLALEAVLRSDAVDLYRAVGGREALELLLVHDFALAILDVHMPEVDGFEVAELMRSSERSRRIPIIFVTAADRDAERRFQGYEAGAVDFLFKPIDARILRQKVGVFLELYEQRAEIAANLRHNEEFVAIVTHDLRSPLAAIMMAADVAARQSDPAEFAKHVARIRRTSGQMLATVNDLLDLSRARLAGGIPIERHVVDFESIVRRAIGDMNAIRPERTIALEVSPGHYRGSWDGARLEQAVTNLLANAMAHATQDPIDVSLSLTAPEGDVTLVVANAGVIAEDELPFIFLPFQRAASRRARGSRNGLGLGLYIVDQIVASHGGSVAARSRDGRTAFEVKLPRAAPV
jgi:signal transduction histidine kinase